MPCSVPWTCGPSSRHFGSTADWSFGNLLGERSSQRKGAYMTTAVLRAAPATSASRADRGLGVLTFFGLVALPLVVYYLWLCVTAYDGSLVLPTSLDQLSDWVSRFPLPTPTAAAIFGGWV